MALPASLQPKQSKKPRSGFTSKLGDFSLWNGQRPAKDRPRRFRVGTPSGSPRRCPFVRAQAMVSARSRSKRLGVGIDAVKLRARRVRPTRTLFFRGRAWLSKLWVGAPMAHALRARHRASTRQEERDQDRDDDQQDARRHGRVPPVDLQRRDDVEAAAHRVIVASRGPRRCARCRRSAIPDRQPSSRRRDRSARCRSRGGGRDRSPLLRRGSATAPRGSSIASGSAAPLRSAGRRASALAATRSPSRARTTK